MRASTLKELHGQGCELCSQMRDIPTQEHHKQASVKAKHIKGNIGERFKKIIYSPS